MLFSAGPVLALLLALASFVFFTCSLLLYDPPLWPDEGIFADPPVNILQKGKFSTTLNTGFVPGMEERTYWQPPLHFFYLTAVFALFGPSVYSLRLGPAALSIPVLLSSFLLARRCGVKWRLGMLAPTLILCDVAFLEGSHVGRNDMLALTFILATLLFAVTFLENPKRIGMAGVAGSTCAFAGLTHPFSITVPAAVALAGLVNRPRPRLKAAALFLGAILLFFLPWILYILQDVRGFEAQFFGQVVRKKVRHESFLTSLKVTLIMHLYQHYLNPVMVAGWWLSGLGGLFLAARRNRHLWALPLFQVLAMAMILWGHEKWYSLYLVPLSAVGLVCLVNEYRRPERWRRVLVPALASTLALWFVAGNLKRAYDVHSAVTYLRNYVDYPRWCEELSRALPSGAKVLLAVTPDPCVPLSKRQDLELRQELARDLTFDAESMRKEMETIDYIVVGHARPTRRVHEWIRDRGRLVKEIRMATPDGTGYYAGIYLVKKTAR